MFSKVFAELTVKFYVKLKELDFVFWPIITYEMNLAYPCFADLKKLR